MKTETLKEIAGAVAGIAIAVILGFLMAMPS